MNTSSIDSHIVLAVVRVIGAHSEAEDSDLVLALQRAGLSRNDAELALAFVPLAFGRVVLRRMGVHQFADHFLISGRSGSPITRLLSEESWYTAAERVARAHWEGRDNSVASSSVLLSREAAQAVVRRSAEVAVAQELLESGAEPAYLAFVEPELMRVSVDMLTGHRRS
jgi:hypothetical protein